MNDINFTMYKLAGIIAEYDPFHNGHAWQLQQAKALGARRVAVAMSCGLPESVRVQAALTCGADLVFALPAPYACSGAECFARAGVQLLAAAGCDALVFGAETPDAALLMEAARVLSGAEYRTALKARPAGQAQQQSGRGILQGHPRAGGFSGADSLAPAGCRSRAGPDRNRGAVCQCQRPAHALAERRS